ncbi:MAG: hypothetical protein ACPK85_09800 [Methanosarcina sp.]
MGKYAHLLILSATIVCLAGSGCIENDDTSEVQDSEISPNIAEAQTGVLIQDLDIGLTQAEINELDSDMAELNLLLEDADASEDVVLVKV